MEASKLRVPDGWPGKLTASCVSQRPAGTEAGEPLQRMGRADRAGAGPESRIYGLRPAIGESAEQASESAAVPKSGGSLRAGAARQEKRPSLGPGPKGLLAGSVAVDQQNTRRHYAEERIRRE